MEKLGTSVLWKFQRVCVRGARELEREGESTLKCLTDERKGSLLVTNRRRVNKALDGGGCASRGIGAKNLTENPSRLAPSEVRGAFRSVPALHSTSILLLLIFPPLHLAFSLRSGRRMRTERHCHNSNSVSLRVLGFCNTATQESLIQMSLLWVRHGPKCHCWPRSAILSGVRARRNKEGIPGNMRNILLNQCYVFQ